MEEIRQFLLQTSIKGIPRAAKAETRLLRYLWVVSSSLFVFFALWQAVALTMEYLEYDSVTVIEERDLQIGSDPDDVPPPEFTVCNLNAYSGNASDIIAMQNLSTLAHFFSLVKDVTSCEGCADNDSRLMADVRHDLLTSHGYYAYVGQQNATKLGNELDNFVVGCFLHKKEGFRSHRVPCNKSQFNMIVNSDYYNCWIMDLPDFADGSLTRISLILHLDNFFSDHYDHFHISYEHGQYIGALIAMHQPDTYPTLLQKSVFLPPGVFSDVKLKVSGRMRSSTPYGNCTSKANIPNSNWLYTRDACLSVCLENAVVAQCNCKDLFTLSVLDNVYPNLPYCNDPGQGHDILLQSTRCASSVRQAEYGSCLIKCPSSCREIKFQPQVSTAVWPPDPFHFEFYDDFIAGKSYEWRYENTSKCIFDNHPVNDIERMLAKDLIYRNFLRVDVSLRDIDYVMYIDSPKTSVSSFLSQLGGSLNLFAGITIVIAIEFLDLLTSILLHEKATCTKGNKTVAIRA